MSLRRYDIMDRIVEKIVLPVPEFHKQLRTVAYARVSSGKDAMLHSLSAQVSYYSKLINNNPEWKFCGVYADEAITGTSDSRPNFLKMIAECRLGNIDVIITKSISRFARNTVTLLETVRELKSLGIDVYFEEQNIHTMSAEGELVLTILGSYAQEESLSASENQKWKIRKAFQEGKVSSIQILGYKRNKDGILEIVPQEAEIVRMIFNNYLAGDGKQKIANILNEKRLRPKYNGIWTESGVNAILTNEKYSGNLLLQKQFRKNHITKKCIKNIGQLPQYYVEEAHEPIIDFETFNAVQKRLALQKRYAPKSDNTSRYPFSGMIHCKCCGKYYRRKTTRTGIVWICHTYNTKGKAYCPTAKQIPENTLFETCCKILSINEFDEYTFKSKITSIIVPEPNKLTFIFYDGHKVDTVWYDRSRSESWTDEMRQNTGERSRQWHARSQGYLRK